MNQVFRIHSLIGLAVWGFFSAVLFGQATDSNIVGIVKDASGAAVPSAQVTATNNDTAVGYKTVSNGTGEYRLNNVPVGTYTIAASATGFAPARTSSVQLELNRTASVNLTLQVASAVTTVEVTEAPAALDTNTSQLQATYGADQARDLPTAGVSKLVNGAGIYNISLTGAGVAFAGGIGYGSGPSVAGQRTDNNTFAIDGVNNDDHDVTGPLVYISNESVSQFSVLQNQFSPEFGGTSGGVFNVIVKSGTNAFHGSVFEYFQNRDLNAVDNSEVLQGIRSNPRFDNNRLGATIGGPIRKDKLFFFANYEYNPLGQASQPGQTVYAPTSAGISLLNGMSNLSKTNLGVFEKYVPVAPVADPTNPITVNGVNIPNGPLSFASPNFDNSYNLLGSVDWNISDRDQVRGRYINNKTTGIDVNAALPVFYGPEPVFNNFGSISEFHNFSPSLENEFRASFSRHNALIPPGSATFPGLNAFPNIAIDELGSLQIGPDPNSPGGGIQNLLQTQDNLTKTIGRHTFKAGYSFTDVILSSYFVQRVRGDYDYATLETFLLDRQPDGGATSGVTGERSFGATGGVPEGFLQHSAFINDDFRVRPNLTLNLGLRYEYVTVPVGSRAQSYSALADVPGVISFNTPKVSTNDWAPRVGFAWSPGTKSAWSVRGGIGRSFSLPYANLSTNANPPYYQTTQDVNTANPVNNFLANGGLTGAGAGVPTTVAGARAAVASYTFDQGRPYALTGTLGVQRLLGKDYTVEARYVYTKGVHLYVQERTDIASPVSATLNIPTYFSTPSATQLAGDTTTLGALRKTVVPGGTSSFPFNDLAIYGFQQNITAYAPLGNSRYNGLALQMTKRYSKNFSYILAYTWSHAQDDSTATVNSTDFTPRRGQDFQNLRADWSDSALDHRQRFTFTPVYDVRFFKDGNWILKNVVSNWSLNGTYTYQTGELATVQSGVDSNLNNDTAGDRAIVNPAGANNVGSGVTPLNAAGKVVPAGDPGIVAYVANNPGARYVVAGLGALANAGRNTLQMPPVNNVDLSLLKRVGITERLRFEIGLQAFNVFNHAQYTGSWVNDVSPNPTLTQTRNELIPSNAKFAEWSQFFASNSRSLQLVARIVF
jgi:hypothetical protein